MITKFTQRQETFAEQQSITLLLNVLLAQSQETLRSVSAMISYARLDKKV